VRLPWRRDPDPLPKAAQRALGRQLRGALDGAMDDAGIKPGGFPDEPVQQDDTDQEDRTT
jgi:hypothetical protein